MLKGRSVQYLKDNIEQCIIEMKQPVQLLKFGSSGRPGFRDFYVTPDLNSLAWTSKNKAAAQTKVDFKDFKSIQFGQRTEKFKRNNRPDLEHLSFSIMYVDPSSPGQQDSLDLVCKDEDEFQMFTLALQALVDGKFDRKRLADQERTWQAEKKSSKRMGQQDAFKGANDVYAFGWGEWGQNGLGTGEVLQSNPLPKLLEHLLGQGVLRVACGWSHSACLLEDGNIVQFGNRTGTGLTEDFFTPTLTKVPERQVIIALACGGFHSAALTDTGHVLTWGCNVHGQLGHGDFRDVSEPKMVEALAGTVASETVRSVICGMSFTAALAVDERGSVAVDPEAEVKTSHRSRPTGGTTRLYTWGCGDHGALGHNDVKDQPIPTLVKALNGVGIQKIAAGHSHMLAATNTMLYSWGWNGCGQLGLGSEEDQYVPHGIDSLKGNEITQIGCGAGHSVALVKQSKIDATVVYTWGSNGNGQLGQGKKKKQLKPQAVTELSRVLVVEVACGAFHTLVRTAEGDVMSCGANKYGQLGHGHTTDSDEFKAIESLKGKNARFLAPGGQHTTVLTPRHWVEDSEVKECMGCKGAFSFVNRKHHCRNCGGIFCNSCSSKKVAILKYGLTEPVRVCNSCFGKLTAVAR